MAIDIQSIIPYLKRDPLYHQFKPFSASFRVESVTEEQSSNHMFEYVPVTVHDVRGLEKPMDLDVNGFCYMKQKTSVTSEMANTIATYQELYFEEIEDFLYNNFPQYSRFECMDLQVRRRHPDFPNSVGKRVEFDQPAGLPHCDFSPGGAVIQMSEAFPGQDKHWKGKDFDLLNIWRVLKGPNDDWPLAVCHCKSVDTKKDCATNDALYLDGFGENWLMQASPNHRWYYMSGQQPEDLIVFRNTDSFGERTRCFHMAIKNSLTVCEPRESIEVRVVAFRDVM
ncbi:uncharacterized protein LY89DRAFT_646248 [Mollisia scopiformis]|uniref:CmcJ-like methyltransferase n=1 Tax=Mollisia scopiformis TaxID=149040 RepID=A0A194XAA8_MOLSC|nr:uncharacterized protein LY89DRAFT_646248 [Mollisia scopiformis]KUJ17108.1 hypothetical protein LY89DRAFT_646248 [Mollisia scopiformis]